MSTTPTPDPVRAASQTSTASRAGKKIKLWPWVAGALVLLWASTELAAGHRQAWQNLVLEARRSGRLSWYDQVVMPPPYLAYGIMMTGVLILAVCTAVWVIRFVKARATVCRAPSLT